MNDISLDLSGTNVAKNTVYNFLGLAIPYAVAFISIPLIIKHLGVERFGLLSLVWIVIGYFSFVDLGLGRATIKYTAEALGRGEFEEVPKIFWTTVLFQGALGLIGTIIIVISSNFFVDKILNIPLDIILEAKKSFFFIGFALPIVLISSSIRGLLEAAQRFDLVNAIKLPVSVSMYLMPLLGVLLGFRLPGIIALFIVVRAISMFAWLIMCFRIFPALGKKIYFDKKNIQLLLKFGYWVSASSILFYLMSSADRFIIASLLTVKELGYYSAPLEIINRLGIIPGSLSVILFPAFSALSGEKKEDYSRMLFVRSIRYILIGVGPLSLYFVFFSKSLFHMWLGPQFSQESSIVFQYLCIGFIISSLSSIPYNYLFGIGKVRSIVIIQVIEIFLYIPLSVLLIKKLGIKGAAVALGIKGLCITLLYFIVSYRFNKISISYYYELGINRIILFIVFISGLLFVFTRYFNLLFAFTMSFIIIFTICFFYILNFKERNYLKKISLTFLINIKKE